MDLDQLQAFCAVAKEGSFSRAARVVFRSQPAVTARIQALEAALGTKLFDRLGRQVRLTPAGQALLHTAGPVLEQWASLPTRVQDALGGALRGPVRLGSGEAAMLYLLPEAIRAFRARHPAVEILVRNQPKEETVAMLKAGELDFGFRAMDTVPQGLLYRPSRTFDRMLIAPKGHPVLQERLTLKALSRYPLVMPWKNSTTRQLVERAFNVAGLRCQVVLEAGGTEIIKRYVALGLGIAVVLEFCLTSEDRKSLAARSVRHLFGQDTYGVVVKQGRQLSRAAQALIRMIDPQCPIEPSR